MVDYTWLDFLGGSDSKESPEMQETLVWSLGQEDTLEKGMATQYSCMENSTDRKAWLAIVHVVAKSWTWLSD